MTAVTKIKTGSSVADAVRATLSDTFALYFKTHSFHWNVTGSQFVSLHALFEEQYTEMWQAMDELAERMRALGSTAPYNTKQMLDNTKIEEAQQNLSADKMIHILQIDHTHATETLQQAIQVAQEAGDEATAGLLTDRLTFHEKQVWMLKSLLS